MNESISPLKNPESYTFIALLNKPRLGEIEKYVQDYIASN